MDTVISDTELRANVKANLNRILAEQEITRYRLSKLTGESEQTIKNVADGDHVPRTSILARIAEALAVTVDDLIAEPKIPAKLGSKKTLRKIPQVA